MSRTVLDVLTAVETQIRSIPLNCYDRDPDPDPAPAQHHWIVLAVDGGNLYSNDIGNRQDATQVYFRPMVVGTDPASTLDALQMLRDNLVGWDPWPDEDSSSRVEEEETTPPLLPSTGVAGAFRYTVTPTYKIRFVR